MKTRPYFLFAFACLMMLGLSCGLRKTFNQALEMSGAVGKEFGYPASVHITYNNHERFWRVSFTSFEVQDYEHEDLEKRAEAVHQFLLDEYDNAEDQDYILIQFSPEEDIDEDTVEKVEFQFDQ